MTKHRLQTARATRSSASCASRPRSRWIASLFAAALLLLPGAARANVNGVTTSPAQATVSVAGGNVNIVWTVNRTEPTAQVARTVSSTAAEFQVGGITIATVGGTISTTSTLAVAASGNVVFRESLPISAALARRLSRETPGNVRIRRLFSDTQSIGTGLISVFAGGASSKISVRRIALSFENDDARTGTYRAGDTVRAVADVAFSGSGTLRGEWRVVDPAAGPSGATGRRVLQVVTLPLSSVGQGSQRIVSPSLPTKAGGLYLVSFSLRDTTTDMEIPILRYYILNNDGRVPETLSPLTPATGAKVDGDTVFSWKPVPGAKAYRVDILNAGKTVTGKIVPSQDTKLSLSSLSLGHLEGGTAYEWRIVALDGKGGTLSRSPATPFSTP